MIKVTYRKLSEGWQDLISLVSKDIRSSVSVQVSKIFNHLKDHMEIFIKKRDQIVQKYSGKLNEEKTEYIFGDDVAESAKKELDELLDLEVVIELSFLTPANLQYYNSKKEEYMEIDIAPRIISGTRYIFNI